MLYPLILTPYYRKCVWGGENLRKHLNKTYSEINIGESFELSCYKNFLCKIENGDFKGTYLKTLVDKYNLDILGFNTNFDFFPLIIKFLDATSRLSVQVHPSDSYALKNESSLGKNELWHVVYAGENSKIVLGLKNNTDTLTLKNSLKEGSIENLLNIEKINVGDSIFIPSGTVHALLEDIIVVEVQQSSDVTYRLYDWDRLENGRGRDLHIEDALNVLDPLSQGSIIRNSDYSDKSFYNLVDIRDFTVDYLKINNSYKDNPRNKTFHVYVCIDGNGHVVYNGLNYKVSKGDTFLIPASLKEYEIKGNLKVLKVYIK